MFRTISPMINVLLTETEIRALLCKKHKTDLQRRLARRARRAIVYAFATQRRRTECPL